MLNMLNLQRTEATATGERASARTRSEDNPITFVDGTTTIQLLIDIVPSRDKNFDGIAHKTRTEAAEKNVHRMRMGDGFLEFMAELV